MRTVTALVFDGFQLLDLMGPLEFIGNLPGEYEIKLVAETPGGIVSHAGVKALASVALNQESTKTDILLIPGGPGTRREIANSNMTNWIAETAEHAEVVATVCTGAALLAATGHLDNHKATTNKNAFTWVAGTRPAVAWQKQVRWIEDGKYFTSSGVSAGMDMALAMIAGHLGKPRAHEVAGWAEYVWNDNANNDPFALP